MGFFDFIGNAVGAVKNLIGGNSSIVNVLGSLAGMVAHAIPGVGPIVDVAVPALQAIFSDGSPRESAPTRDSADQPANIINLNRSDEVISGVITSCQKVQDTLYRKIDDSVKELNENFDNLTRLLRHEKYKNLQVRVVSAVKFMDTKQDVLKRITASSGPGAFEQIFPTSGEPAFTQERKTLSETIDKIKSDLEDEMFVPSQDMVELYLFSIHWLLLFDKTDDASVIVCRGMLAKSEETWGQYTSYLNTLGLLRSDIWILRRDAKDGKDTLKTLRSRLTLKREDSIIPVTNAVGAAIGTPDTAAGTSAVITVKDTCDVPLVGTTPTGLEAKLAKSNLALYKDVMVQTLQASLQPCDAVIESLEDSMRNWKVRLPISPIKLPGDRKHATPVKPQKDKTCPVDAQSKFWGHSVAYAVTYVNTYGESPESEWSDGVKIPRGCTAVIVELEKVQFDDDFTANLKQIKKDGELVPRDRGIRRRVYVRYTNKEEKSVMERIRELGEDGEEFHHKILEKVEPPQEDQSTDELPEATSSSTSNGLAAKKKRSIGEAVAADELLGADAGGVKKTKRFQGNSNGDPRNENEAADTRIQPKTMAPTTLYIPNSTLTNAQYLFEFDISTSSPLRGLEFWVFCSVCASLVVIEQIMKWNAKRAERARVLDEVEEKLTEYLD